MAAINKILLLILLRKKKKKTFEKRTARVYKQRKEKGEKS